MSLETVKSKRDSVASPTEPQRVLMLAYTCSPYRGSEPGVGWHRAVEMAKHFEMWVITEEHEFKDDIEQYLLENGPIENLQFLFVPRIVASAELWRRIFWIRPLYYSAYSLWHRRAYRVARDLCSENRFDLVHQSTMCGFREPGRLWRLDAPFIWGPVGGTQSYPWRFLPQAGFVGLLKEGARNIVNSLQLRFTPRVRKAARRADALLTAIPAGQGDFKRIHGVDSICMLDVGISGVIGEPRTYQGRKRPLRLLWSGYFGHHKALQLLLKALAQLPESVDYELRILGKGPRQRAWQKLAGRLGAQDHCTWLGWLPHNEAKNQNIWADVFVFTSLRDTCGSVVLEALSQGLPIICLDHQGVGSVVTDRCGIKVPVTTPRQVVRGLRDAIARAARDDERLEALSRGAIERAQDYRWQRHGERLADLYCDLFANHEIAEGQRRPELSR